MSSVDYYWARTSGLGYAANSTVYADFKVPVNNLSFYLLNTYAQYGFRVADIYVWSNYQYYGSWYVNGNVAYYGVGAPIFIDLSSVPRVTGLKIVGASRRATGTRSSTTTSASLQTSGATSPTRGSPGTSRARLKRR